MITEYDRQLDSAIDRAEQINRDQTIVGAQTNGWTLIQTRRINIHCYIKDAPDRNLVEVYQYIISDDKQFIIEIKSDSNHMVARLIGPDVARQIKKQCNED